MRQPWTESEIHDLKSGLSWAAFSAKHPSRSYDSWEVKRRRAGGSAGTRVRPHVDRVLFEKAVSGLNAITDFLEAVHRG